MTDKTPSARKPGKQIDKTVRVLDRAAAKMRKDASLSKSAALRESGITDAREIKRLVAMLPPVRNAAALGKTPRSKSPSTSAMPLRATAPKKVGNVSEGVPAKPALDASYQPKTATATPSKSPQARAAATAAVVPDIFAFTQPWMRLGMQMAFTGLTLQMRMAKAAMAMSPATAMQRGAEMLNGWMASTNHTGSRRPKN